MASAAECVRFEQESFGALHQMLAGLDDAEHRPQAGQQIRERLAAFETADGFVGPCELVVVAGTRPGQVSRDDHDVAAVQAAPVFLDRDATTERLAG